MEIKYIGRCAANNKTNGPKLVWHAGSFVFWRMVYSFDFRAEGFHFGLVEFLKQKFLQFVIILTQLSLLNILQAKQTHWYKTQYSNNLCHKQAHYYSAKAHFSNDVINRHTYSKTDKLTAIKVPFNGFMALCTWLCLCDFIYMYSCLHCMSLNLNINLYQYWKLSYIVYITDIVTQVRYLHNLFVYMFFFYLRIDYIILIYFA